RRPARAVTPEEPVYTRLVHAGSASAALPRRLAQTVSPVVFRRIARAAVGVLIVIVASGATVRLTGSGLGCPEWPTCTTQHALPQSYHSDIEFGNRVVSALTIFTTLALAVAAWLTRGLGRRGRWLATAVFVGTLAQAPLGAITVYYDLDPYLVITHLLLSFTLVSLAVLTLLEAARDSRRADGDRRGAVPDLRRRAVVARPPTRRDGRDARGLDSGARRASLASRECGLDSENVGADRLLAAGAQPPGAHRRLPRLERRRAGRDARRRLPREGMGSRAVRGDRLGELPRLPGGAPERLARGRYDAQARVALEHVPPRADPGARPRRRDPARRRAEPPLEDVHGARARAAAGARGGAGLLPRLAARGRVSNV